MSDIAVTWAKAQRCPSARAKATLVHLAAYCDAEGEGWAAVSILALEMEVDDRTVQRGLSALRKAGLIAETGDRKTWQGRKVPIYRLALDMGPANTRQRLLMERAEQGVAAHCGPSTGDMAVTPRVTQVSPHGRHGCHPTGDTDVTQIGKLKTSTEAERIANALLSEDASASDDDVGEEAAAAPSADFRTGFAAWPASGAAATFEPEAWAAWVEQAALAGDEAKLLACVLAFVADPALRRRSYGAPGMQNWLRRGGWRSYEARVEAAAATLSAVPGGRFPEGAIRALAVEALGPTDGPAAIDGCGWDAEGRVVLARTGWAFDRINRLWSAGADWTVARMGR